MAQRAALLAEFKVVFLIFRDCFCGLGAKVAGLLTACLPTQTGDEAAKAADILRVEDRPAGADERTEFPSQHAGPDILEVVEREFPHFLTG